MLLQKTRGGDKLWNMLGKLWKSVRLLPIQATLMAVGDPNGGRHHRRAAYHGTRTLSLRGLSSTIHDPRTVRASPSERDEEL